MYWKNLGPDLPLLFHMHDIWSVRGLLLVKIIKIGATKCSILWLNCTKFDFGWGSAPDPAGGAYSAPPDPLAGLREPTTKVREGREKEGMGKEEEREGRGKEGRGREGREGK